MLRFTKEVQLTQTIIIVVMLSLSDTYVVSYILRWLCPRCSSPRELPPALHTYGGFRSRGVLSRGFCPPVARAAHANTLRRSNLNIVMIASSSNDYVRQGRYVMPGVCLSVCLSKSLFVCLLATLRKNY